MWANKDRYEGNWKDDLHDGKGELTWHDGTQYEGDWKEGKRHGTGTYYYSDGNVQYAGLWKEDIQ